uniref:Uncharacterized protein n=1 Tax=Anopheles braziliensis TaxID=58242 RepID=A0A2M3ZLB1_9DIPT
MVVARPPKCRLALPLVSWLTVRRAMNHQYRSPSKPQHLLSSVLWLGVFPVACTSNFPAVCVEVNVRVDV